MKPQSVRLLDVFVFGPVMIYAATQPRLSVELRAVLFWLGAGTILYNGINYLKGKR